MDIAEAWNQMIEGQPVTSEDIGNIVNEIRRELVRAMCPDSSDPEGEVSAAGYRVSAIDTTSRQFVRSIVDISGPKGRRTSIGAQIVHPNELVLCIPQPETGEFTQQWAPNDDVPQRQWIRDNLQAHVVSFLSATPLNVHRP